ncbi:MAG TPA: ATP-binding protein [Steroidobacteraceae bacterium]|jgi:two-component system sensor histidine kinase/response regulator|nr:ATP-binding protein [Steroidobacteraceae bacterium]
MNPETRTGTGRLLVVDDEEPQMRALCETLSAEGFITAGFSAPQAALAELERSSYDLMLTDLMMPGMDGISLLAAARRIDPELVGIMMTGHGSIDSAVRAMQAGALDYIQKPFRLKVILPVLRRGMEIRRLRLENSELRAAQATIQRLNEELEERVRARTRELEIANQELALANQDLESFSFSVSHDLRAPLRTIRELSRVFLEDFGNVVPEEGRALLTRVEEGGARMSRLIEDLLAFSRFSRQPLEKRPVVLGDLARRLARDLRPKEGAVEVVIGDLPDCHGDASLLEQVLSNLLSNAFKFSRKTAAPRVEVGSLREGNETVYFVRDNGAGFDMRRADKLFGVFQRLHPASEFEGTGVGLSIVQRIVQRHGGRIWAESAPGRGATFYFTLERTAAASDGAAESSRSA